MDWVAEGPQPGFPELTPTHLGTGKAEKLLKALALMVFFVAQLKSIAPACNVQVFKLKLVALLRSTSTRRRLPTPLEKVINGAMSILAVTRCASGVPCLRGSAPSSARALTLREAALIDNKTSTDRSLSRR